jgi:hypothetical protein
MKHLKQFENKSSLKNMTIEDISELVDRLNYLRDFIEKKISDDDIMFFSKINRIHTDVKLLSSKLKYK